MLFSLLSNRALLSTSSLFYSHSLISPLSLPSLVPGGAAASVAALGRLVKSHVITNQLKQEVVPGLMGLVNERSVGLFACLIWLVISFIGFILFGMNNNVCDFSECL